MLRELGSFCSRQGQVAEAYEQNNDEPLGYNILFKHPVILVNYFI
jgi:hypothetical protein